MEGAALSQEVETAPLLPPEEGQAENLLLNFFLLFGTQNLILL